MSQPLRIGVIGGSGLYEMAGLTHVTETTVDTPYGAPSDAFIIGTFHDVELVFLPRHGRGHRLNPSEVPYRANIYGMKSLGVSWIISVSAVGSLQENIPPGDVVVIDQFIDRTKNRPATFFEDGLVAHIAFGDPVCTTLRNYLLQSAVKAGAQCHDGGTYVCMEGPAFSTRAESFLYRSWGATVIGIAGGPEKCAWLTEELGFDAAIDICPSDKPSKRILKHMDTPENQPDFGLATTPFEAPEGWPGYHVLLSK